MTDAPPTTPPAPAWSALLLALAGLELVLAGLARVASVGGWCPVEGQVFGCAGVQRPRVSQLGPVMIGDLAILGASLAVGVAALFLWRGVRLPWARDGAVALAACAGVALGVQPLAWLAGGLLCPTCLGVALCALGVAGLTAWLAHRGAQVPPRLPLAVAAAALLATAAGATWRGLEIQRADAARSAAALAAGGQRGPRIVLVALEGCPFCQATLADVLGDPDVVALLDADTRGLERVGIDHPLAAGLHGVPVLRALDAAEHDLVEPLSGYPSLQEGYDWLRAAIDAAGDG